MTERTRSIRDSDLIKVAYANDQMEAEFLQNLRRDADVGSVVRRTTGFEVPEFLAAGPRDPYPRSANLSPACQSFPRLPIQRSCTPSPGSRGWSS